MSTNPKEGIRKRSQNRYYLNQKYVPIGYFLIFSILLQGLLMSSGVTVKNSLSLTLAIIAQWLPGAMWWRGVNKTRKLGLVELIGMGLAIGTLLALLSAQLFRASLLGEHAWSFPFFISLPLALWSVYKSKRLDFHRIPNDSKGKIVQSVLPAILLGLIQLSVWWRWHPLEWAGWWKYHTDISYFESFSNSLAILGTTHSLMDFDLNSRYHWFSYAWVGSLTNSLNIDSFVVLTRLLPIIAMTMGLTIAYSWARSMSVNYFTAGLASLVIVIGPGLSVGSFIMLRSPSSAMSVGWSLAFVVVLFKVIKVATKQFSAYALLILLSIGLVGGKATNTILVAFAVVALLISSFAQNQEIKKRIWISGCLCLVVLSFTFVLLIASSESRRLAPGIFLGWPGLLLTILPTSIGIWGLYRERTSKLEPINVFIVSLLSLGAILSLLTYDPHGNQLYFLVSAAAMSVVPSIVGLEKILIGRRNTNLVMLINKIDKRARFFVLLNLVLAGAASTFIWKLFENSTSQFGKIGRTLAPFPMWLVCITISLVIARAYSKKEKTSKQLIGLVPITVVLASAVSSCLIILSSTIGGPLYSNSSGIVSYGKSYKTSPGAISPNYLNAGNWVQSHIPFKDKLFTNRHCMEIEFAFTDCDGIWSYASALTRRQFLIEGATSSYPSDILSNSEDQNLSIRFSLSPNQKDLESLWAKNVRWGWIDRKVSSRTDWGVFAQQVFSNEDIVIIELSNPKG